MEDWEQHLQSILIAVLFAYLLAKLISVILAFKGDHLSVSRHASPPTSPRRPLVGSSHASESSEVNSLTGDHGSGRKDYVGQSSDDDAEDSDDWEGVESTDLDEAFSSASAFVASMAIDKNKVPMEKQLQLYGLYKIATEGPCSVPQPSPLKVTARAKWQAWQKLGAMPTEDAMQCYIDIVTELYPSWTSASVQKKREGGAEEMAHADGKGPMGPVFSSMIYEEESADNMTMDAIHGFAREGELENLVRCLDKGISVNLKDSEGRTPLHWAVDRGHLNIVEFLVENDVDLNSRDSEGQTSLHYAALCEREAIAEYLVNHGADAHARDDDGMTPRELCRLNWRCLDLPANAE